MQLPTNDKNEMSSNFVITSQNSTEMTDFQGTAE